MDNHQNVKILIIQLRKDEIKQHEYDGFLQYTGLSKEHLVSLDVFHDEISVDALNGFDAVIIAGSGEFGVFDEELKEINKRLDEIVHYCYENNFPFIGSCLGHQMAALFLGGEVTSNKENMEVGSIEVSTTPEARQDPIFKHLPEKFWGQVGHKQTVLSVPQSGIILAYSDKCPVHAFTFQDKPFYGFQIHPELGKEGLIRRVNYYKSYSKDQAEMNQIIREAKESPSATNIPKLFIREFLSK